MKRSLLLGCVLVTAYAALAQRPPHLSPAGEPPADVRNGRALLVNHFSDSKQMVRLAFGLVRPHLAEEERFLQELMTPSSPQFHKFLTAEEWNSRFSPSVADEQAVVDWATSQGLTVTHRFPNRLIVDAEAPLATVEKALQVRINNYLLDGYTYYANEREPVIPTSVSSVIRSVGGLHNFPVMHPASSKHTIPPGAVYNPGPVVGAPLAHHADADRTKFAELQKKVSENNSTNITSGAYDPTDIYSSTAYNYNALQNQGHCCNPNHLAGGSPPQSSIALAVFGNLHFTGTPPNVNFTDVLGFQAQYPYLAFFVTFIPIDGGPSTCTVGPKQPCNNDGETALDTEWSMATANSFGSFLDTAHVFVYAGGGSAEDVYNQMLSDENAKIFSTSWSCTEISGCSASEMDTRHGIFNAMTGQGWTLMTASGDRGATDDCSVVGVSYPAVDPNVVGVGGTALQTGNTFTSEVAWTGGTSAGSCGGNNGGSGGGCSVHYSTIDAPFQSGSNGTCGTQRSVPDIALNAAVGQNFFFNGQLGGVGGTSISSPMLAGFFAQEGAYLVHLANVTGNSCGSHSGSGEPCSPINGGMGNGNTYLYYFGQHPSYAPHYPFYDITSGCNSNDITAANNYSFFCAGTGYDSVTGWGTANMLQLAWAINTFIAGDFGPPAVNFSGPAVGQWFNTNQTVSWSITDTSANGAVPNGVAGFSQAWDSDPGDPASELTPGTGNSFYSGPQFPNGTTGSLILNNSLEGCHTVHVRGWDNGGSSSDNTYGPTCFDDIPPVVHCDSPDGLWHATDVIIQCTASDSPSGLAIPADASFTLTTSVPPGTESAASFTNSHAVADVAGNNTTAGPIGPNMVDKTNPVITITQPTATNYTHSSTLVLGYTVTDTGSGVGTVTPTMNGSGTIGGNPVINGLSINLLTQLSLGPNTFAITAYDKVLNKSTASVTFNIIVTPASIIGDVTQLAGSGGITMNTQSLLSKLTNAQADAAAGNCAAAISLYGAFINEVNAQAGKGITAAAAAILIGDAQYLETHCP